MTYSQELSLLLLIRLSTHGPNNVHNFLANVSLYDGVSGRPHFLNSFSGSRPASNQPRSEVTMHVTELGIQGALAARRVESLK